jgi:hypothetical protein
MRFSSILKLDSNLARALFRGEPGSWFEWAWFNSLDLGDILLSPLGDDLIVSLFFSLSTMCSSSGQTEHKVILPSLDRLLVFESLL